MARERLLMGVGLPGWTNNAKKMFHGFPPCTTYTKLHLISLGGGGFARAAPPCRSDTTLLLLSKLEGLKNTTDVFFCFALLCFVFFFFSFGISPEFDYGISFESLVI